MEIINSIIDDNQQQLGAGPTERDGAGHVARCTVERLIGALGPLHGVRRAESPSTTRSASQNRHPTDLLRRRFEAFTPNGRWVVDITYVRTSDS